jgi:hypothetical protein
MNDDLYEVWHGFIRRCHDPRRKDYAKYGGHGIRVCEEWRGTSDLRSWSREGYQEFEKWALSHGWKKGMTLDRVNNGAGYGPNNCRWVSKKGQAYNRRINVYITHEGKTKTLTQWAKDTGIPDYVICKRRKAGWSDAEALTIPVGGKRK